VNALLAIVGLAAPILIAGAFAFRLALIQKRLRLLLAFSAAYLFAIAIIHMLPEAFTGDDRKLVGLFIVLGFCIQLVIDTFSTGIEHGHVHLHSEQCHDHLPYGIIVGLFLHSFLEGLPVYDLNAQSTGNVNYQLVLGLGIHNLPITLAFATLLREHKSGGSRRWLLLLLFAFMSPLGFLASYFLQSVGLNDYQTYSELAYAVVIGIFLHISTAILFETSEQHRYSVRKALAMALGIVAAYLIS
jgi:zinc and cadmium transporter